MFSETYPTFYRDRFGEIATTIHNDGKELRMILRHVAFHGSMLDDWEPDESIDATQLQQFAFTGVGELCDYTLEFAMPVPLIFQAERLCGTLHIHLTLGVATPNGGTDREVLFLRLDIAGLLFSSQGKVGWFEDEFFDIAKQFPEGVYLQTCFGCAFSDYSPVGNGLFGGLACFKENKQLYLAVKTKRDLFPLLDDPQTVFVQETYHCGEFERRKPGTGYRG